MAPSPWKMFPTSAQVPLAVQAPDRVVVDVGHVHTGDQHDDGEQREGDAGHQGLAAVLAPQQPVHRTSSRRSGAGVLTEVREHDLLEAEVVDAPCRVEDGPLQLDHEADFAGGAWCG